MRNLKRALSLTLASVMLLGMMVVGSSAAAGYDDVSETDNVEAIEVLQTVEVMVGDERGFGPERPVNRAEMAVVMAKLLSLDYNYYTATCPFDDVYDWARGYVGACAANGIVSGRGDGIYDPGATVTAVEAASMLMRALGYFKYSNDYADGFEVSTVRQGTIIGIFEGVGSSATEPMTRNQVAQMVLNALQCAVVEPDGNTTTFLDPNGSIIATTGKVNYVSVTSNQPYAQAISRVQATSVGSDNSGYIVELGERLYNGSLKLNDRTMDDFYRPTRTWEFDSKTIGSYVKKELLKAEYTDKVTGRMLYDLLSKDVIEDYDFEIAVDGVNTATAGARNTLTAIHSPSVTNKDDPDYCTDRGCSYFTTGSLDRSNTDGVGRTGKGVKTEVYVDASKDVEKVYIAVMNTYLAIADKDYDSKRDEVTLTGYNMVNNGSSASPIYVKENDQDVKLTVDGEDFAIEDVKKDDKFLVTVADGRVQSMIAPEVLSEVTISSFKRDSWVNADGTQYDHATTARYDEEVLEFYDQTNMKDVTYNIVLDEYGYLIGLELNEKTNQYVFVTGTDRGESNLYETNARVNVIFLDGTMETITVNTKKSDVDWTGANNNSVTGGRNLSQVNTWCTYTKDSNNVYTLTEVGIDSTLKTAKKVAQSAMDAVTYNSTTAPRGVGEFDINNKNVSLNGANVDNPGPAPAAVGDFKRVYGNDDTVYINTELEEIIVKDGNKPMFIITDVDSVTTGVKNVDMTVKNYTKQGGAGTSANPHYEEHAENEAYILYNKDGYIIGVVTLAAEDKGTSAKYAYITSDVNQEDYLGNDEWKWSQNAIIDGEKVVLTEVDDSSAYLNTTEVGKWYEVRFNADGNVSGLKENDKISTTADDNRATLVSNNVLKSRDHSIYFDFTKDRFINDMSEVKDAVNGNKTDYEDSKTVLLFVDYCTDGAGKHDSSAARRADLSFKNGTLYTDTAQTEGFSVSPTVNVVLALAAKNHGKAFDDVRDGYTGYPGVEDALKDLDSSADAFDGFLCAVIENGDATSIIFDERAGANRSNLEPVKPMTMTVYQVDESDNVLGTKTFKWDGTTLDGTEVTPPNGYTYKDKKGASDFAEGQTGTVTFIYSQTGGGDVPTKTGYISVQFKVGASTLGDPVTVPVSVDPLGKGTLTENDLKKYIPAGYELSGFSDTAVTDQTGAGTINTTDVAVAELPNTDISAIAVSGTGKFAWAKYGTAPTAATIKTDTVKFDLTYPNGVRTVDADFGTNAITFADKAGTTGTNTWKQDGLATATINGKSCDLPVKIYADLAGVTAGSGLSTVWNVAATESDTKSGKITLTFTQKGGQETDFDTAEMTALVGKLKDNSTLNLTVGAFSNASLKTKGVQATPTAAEFTVEVAVSAPTNASVTLLIDAEP